MLSTCRYIDDCVAVLSSSPDVASAAAEAGPGAFTRFIATADIAASESSTGSFRERPSAEGSLSRQSDAHASLKHFEVRVRTAPA
jgi:hypothetical protein